jgi:hypothetical protein
MLVEVEWSDTRLRQAQRRREHILQGHTKCEVQLHPLWSAAHFPDAKHRLGTGAYPEEHGVPCRRHVRHPEPHDAAIEVDGARKIRGREVRFK